MKGLVEYAKVRGVKIIPEFDAPAHVGKSVNSYVESKNVLYSLQKCYRQIQIF